MRQLRSLGEVFDTADRYTRIGAYERAVDVLGELEAQSGFPQTEYAIAKKCVLLARNKLHMRDEAGAVQYLTQIPASQIAANPQIEAEHHAVSGLLKRREAYSKWKASDTAAAIATADQAMACFQAAKEKSLLADDSRLHHATTVSALYTACLLLAIRERPADCYLEHVVEAVVAEATSRRHTSEEERNDLTGLTLIADMALGAKVSPGQLVDYMGDGPHRAACRRVLRDWNQSWPQLLLREVQLAPVDANPDFPTRALLLGAKILLDEPRASVDGLMWACAARLQMTYSDQYYLHGPNSKAGRDIQAMLRRFPTDILRYVKRPRFLR